jgi:hypothetical protein
VRGRYGDQAWGFSGGFSAGGGAARRAARLAAATAVVRDGVAARCDGCSLTVLAGKAIRDYFACAKAAWDAVRRRPPAVHSPTSQAVHDALRAA